MTETKLQDNIEQKKTKEALARLYTSNFSVKLTEI